MVFHFTTKHHTALYILFISVNKNSETIQMLTYNMPDLHADNFIVAKLINLPLTWCMDTRVKTI